MINDNKYNKIDGILKLYCRIKIECILYISSKLIIY
jgi:hypothetical protein